MNDAEIAAGLAPTPGYRYADRVGSQLFVAGQVPHDRDSQMVAIGDPKGQAGQCLDNLQLLLMTHAFSVADIRRLTVYVVGSDQNLHDAWQGVADWFQNGVPPATLLGVANLGHDGQLVEIDATVVAA